MLKQATLTFCQRHLRIAKIAIFTLYPIYSKNEKGIIKETICLYSEKVKPYYYKQNEKRMARYLSRDILYSKIVYRINYKEYFLFDFYTKNEDGREQYWGRHLHYSYLNKRKSSESAWIKFKNKYKTYQIFSRYYKREMILVESNASLDKIDLFLQKHNRVIFKPCDAALGTGVHEYNVLRNQNITELKDMLRQEMPFVAEEYVIQDDRMKRLHSQSVNTVRIITYNSGNNDVRILYGMLRMGTGDSCIDNAEAGGISAAIDLDCGIVNSLGFAENGKTYIKHPDSDVTIVGFEIPEWGKLKSLVKELANVVPEQKYVGWDLALRNGQWIMIEGNDCAYLTAMQMTHGRGIKHELLALLKNE